MKKCIFIVLLLLIVSIQLFSQPKPRILGVVMGISKYQNVPSLRYADRDAMSFYNFLLSPAGGAADTNNIRLLLNEKATSYNFFEAMDNLLDMAKEGDQAYIYFAGHGDIEKKTERQNGFLIGSNAPANCYAAGGCIGVRYLQDYVETLVSKNKSKVTLIIDACRSGKLAGGSQGAEITALALQAEWKGVTKILSCQPGETSLEGEQWGGGAGVFTYFMLKGMLGQADENGDGKVTAMELGTYLDKIVMKETHEKQLPEIVGDRRQDITKVDKKHALALLNQMERPISLPQEKQSAGFEIDKSSIDDISFLKEYEKFKYYINNNNLIAYNEADKDKETALSIYRSLEKTRIAQPIITKMKGELLSALQNKAQLNMNNWMNSIIDTSNIQSVYNELKTAYELIDSTHPQFKDIKVKYLFWCGRMYERGSDNRMKLMEQCIRISPEFEYPYIDIGICYLNNEKYFEAIKYFDKAIELSNSSAWFYGYRGYAKAKFKDIVGAIDDADKAVNIDSSNYLTWFWKAQINDALFDYNKAMKCYDKTIELKPDYSDAIREKGLILIKLGKPDEAIKFLNRTIELKPDDFFAWYNKGNALFTLGRYIEGINCYNKSIEINPDYYGVWINKSRSLGIIGNYQEALECCDRAIQINPLLPDAWNNKGIALKHLRKYDEAIQSYNRLLELKPNNEDAWFNKALTLNILGKNEEAINCLDKALELKPDYYEAWYFKGSTFRATGNLYEAIKFYDKALEIKPDYFLSLYDRACAFSLLKKKSEMLNSLKSAIELYPKFKESAPKDEDFKEYWNDSDFLELVK